MTTLAPNPPTLSMERTMLTSRVIIPSPEALETEDIFSSSIGTLFTDDTVNSHGTPGSSIIYKSPLFGDISLRVPAHPDVEEGRKLFAHYLWNSAVIAAEAIETASYDRDEANSSTETTGGDDVKRDRQQPCSENEAGEIEQRHVQWDRKYWDVRDKVILELGSGTALPSLISALCGATTNIITDHPSSPALTTGVVQQNVHDNLYRKRVSPGTESSFSEPIRSGEARTASNVQINGYTWGTTTMYSTTSYGRPASPQPAAGSMDRIIVADCLWMPSQHANIVKTILHYLMDSSSDRAGQDDGGGCALVIAGFHTGRKTVKDFFQIATAYEAEEGDENDPGIDVRGKLRAAEIFEVDVYGSRRAWQPHREGEDKAEAKKWCVCAALVRR